MNCQRQQPFDELSSKSDAQDIVFNLNESFYLSEISTISSCSHVRHESSKDNPVIGLDHSILINFGLIILFPLLYGLILFICCCKKKKMYMKVDTGTQTD